MTWQEIAAGQGGLITRAQLRAAGVRRNVVARRVAVGRWQMLSPTVVATFTGAPRPDQLLWLGVLHGGEGSLVGGIHAVVLGGLKNWERDTVLVFVPADLRSPSPLGGFRFVRTRRDLAKHASASSGVPRCRAAIAALLFASAEPNRRTADGLLAACVQQRIAAPGDLETALVSLGRIPRAARLRQTIAELAGGAQSVAELDVGRMCRTFGMAPPRRQVKRRDAEGRVRYTDCEWVLADGRILVLEVDGLFHMDVDKWEDDLARQRALSGTERIIVRCTARELRDDPERVARDLLRLGVPRLAA